MKTSPGWPEPSEWFASLLQDMQQRADAYEAEPDQLLRRNKAAGMLGRVLAALNELPPIKEGHAHLPLKDLLIFLSDLDRGRAHPWSKPVNFGGTNITTAAENELRNWANALVHLLRDAGLKPTESYKAVAKELDASGRTGAGGSKVSWRSVQQWHRNIGDAEQTIVGTRVMGWWRELPCVHGQLAIRCSKGSDGRCSEIKAIALKCLPAAFGLPHIRDRFHSVQSD